MRAVEFIDSFGEIETQIDDLTVAAAKIEALEKWLARIHKVDTIVMLDFGAKKTFCAGNVNSESFGSDEFFSYIESLSSSPAVIAPQGTAAAVLAPCVNGTGEFVYFPLARENGQCLGALLLFMNKPREYFSAHRNELKLVAHKMRDILVIEGLRQAPREPSPEAGCAGKLETWLEQGRLEQAKTFINMMNFPMFIMQTDGELIAVNQSLLYRLKFSNLPDFMRRCDIFQDLFQHGETLKTLTREGGIRSRKLILHDSIGERMTVTMSAVLIKEFIVGSLFDVSEYVRITDDLRESLKMQEFLNDKLISAALLLHKTQSSAIRSLARLAEFRDHETGDHLQRICEYSKLIAQEVFKRQPYSFKIRSEYCDDIFLSSMLHDIGKVGIPDHILLKKGKLDEDEWKIMRSHTVIGWTILNQADCELGEQSFLTLASQIALNHHERWDGTGYPYGLGKDKIPLSARISAVADVYDALTSQRPYKKAWHHDDAITEIKSKSDVSFDPVIVDILLSIEKKVVDIHYQFPK